jgi:hypothetical protein
MAASKHSSALDIKVWQESIPAGSTLTLREAHDHKVILLDTLTGSIVTLPPARGSGAHFKFVVSVLATSNSHIIKVANTVDTMMGQIVVNGDDAANAAVSFSAGATDDTITLNRSTTGSVVIGEMIVLEDVAPGKWLVWGFTNATGVEATPFSATV